MLTKYVLNIIKEADAIRGTINHQVISIFKDAEASTCSKQDIDALKIIGGALSMSYSDKDDSYVPMFIMDNGARSFSMDDISQDAIVILSEALDAAQFYWIRAKLADILWMKTTNFRYANIAATENMNIFDEVFDATHWVECFAAISRANAISLRLGKSSDLFKALYKRANHAICKLDGNDPLFLSLNLIRMIHTDASNEDLSKYLCIVNKIVENNMQHDNVHLVEDAFSVLELLLKRLKRDKDVLSAEQRLATYYAELASKQKTQGVNGTYQAIDNLQKAYNIFRKLKNQDEIFRIRKEIENLQNVAVANMPSIPFEFETKQIYASVKQLFERLSLQEKIVQLGRIVMIYHVEDVKTQVLMQQREFIFKSMFGNCILDKRGHTIEIIPPLSLDDPEADSETLFKHMVQYVTERRLLGETIILGYAFKLLQCETPFTADQFNFLTDNNPIIPEGRSNIIKIGLHVGLTGDLYTAMHILLPQTEHIFRNLVFMCGDTVTFLKEDGTEDYKPLSQLFKSDKLQECYDENIIFSFRSILDEKAGSNFRNLVAHGLLDADAGNSGVALCFLCLLIRLLSLYSKPALEITTRLKFNESKREKASE